MSIPTRRFGRTEVQMPVLTCGGMRYQQAWDDLDPDTIAKEGQANLEATIHYALDHGINHIETARGYGSSEMQLGWVLSKIDRERFFMQTKIGLKETAAEFLEAFEISMQYLQLDHVDFLSIHGINQPDHIETSLRKGGSMDAIRKLQKEGRVRFCGFSTHAGPETVCRACETGEFDYVNLHWYFIYNQLHWPMVEAAAAMDMGVFIISPNDKGGMLYNPTEKMARLCEPITPMQWNALYCLSRPEVHTLSIGASKPSDFDEHIESVTRYWDDRKAISDRIEAKIIRSMESDLGSDWVHNWPMGLPHFTDTPNQINVKEILRLWTFYKGLDLDEFAKMRYNLLGNADHWFPGQQAGSDPGTFDWSCLERSPFRDKIPALLEESHQLFHIDKEAKRLSES